MGNGETEDWADSSVLGLSEDVFHSLIVKVDGLDEPAGFHAGSRGFVLRGGCFKRFLAFFWLLSGVDFVILGYASILSRKCETVVAVCTGQSFLVEIGGLGSGPFAY